MNAITNPFAPLMLQLIRDPYLGNGPKPDGDELTQRIIDLHKRGLNQYEIARKANCTQPHVSKVLSLQRNRRQP